MVSLVGVVCNNSGALHVCSIFFLQIRVWGVGGRRNAKILQCHAAVRNFRMAIRNLMPLLVNFKIPISTFICRHAGRVLSSFAPHLNGKSFPIPIRWQILLLCLWDSKAPSKSDTTYKDKIICNGWMKTLVLGIFFILSLLYSQMFPTLSNCLSHKLLIVNYVTNRNKNFPLY